ncbi:hypothetical protein DWZ34_12645 [Phocaeicola plebeius]|uniref:Uncharacterized protein n=1 Tax=Phocaeicola plebeius TaxID=310297 RepID=A0A415T027_9BACT|nr:hypothetical protein [Phocaeicola plebeius]RHA27266.1 hypothetical protein DW941_14175 [Phocaeicola plebeius]RHA30822.1 hypothetical protein DW939_13765 [Phocaeicola plebeius]RHF89003.1 hypothetical protein DW653_11405 [Phocaeicola plebeius]RHM94593.1 hypothetical protein DWZ34_12645 [Phocaeicola plebeius]
MEKYRFYFSENTLFTFRGFQNNSLYCVFHSIRFKVNKGWSSAELLFLCPYAKGCLFFRNPVFLENLG